jgi:hypothetical protein
MRLDSILILPGNAEATHVTSAGSQSISIRQAGDFDRFAEDLGRCTSARVEIDDALLLPPVSGGVLYICRPDVIDRSIASGTDRPRLLASRTVVADIVRTYAFQQTEELGLAAAIESQEYFFWQGGRKPQRHAALYGLKTAGRIMGATLPEIPAWEGSNYARLRDSSPRGLPAFLAAYLEAYANLL